ncbi:hypothetical protein BDN71DRAFT_1396007 [Pleurotus eryngii]|uniref:HTH CENPB-type domain-containing protein n=1 Tax=Pleurotus eryngii TaxID=5323 RepID=A0A9P6DE80_PLEER|nr:hypothetical protein BDN71DRAFT_1396007 [Pleurotus eryngii]
MVGRPKSKAQRQQEHRRIRDSLYQEAKQLYLEEHRQNNLGAKKRGLREICAIVLGRHRERGVRTDPPITSLSASTLGRLVNGGVSQSVSNASRGWLTKTEEDIVVKFVIEMANHGFPLSHARLKDHVDCICRARLGDEFPKEGVGVNWTERFI